MSNDAYIELDVAPSLDDFSRVLENAARRVLGSRWKVHSAGFSKEPTWLVTIPGTALQGRLAMQKLIADGEDFGFVVSLEDSCIAFRRPLNHFESWAQGCVAEELADHYDRGVLFDATDVTYPPGTRQFRVGTSFYEYATKNLKKPLSAEDADFIDRRFKPHAPDGFWL